MGSVFREVLQKQLELLTRVLNDQHELELEKMRHGLVTYHSEADASQSGDRGSLVEIVSPDIGINGQLQRNCDVELEPVHMLRDDSVQLLGSEKGKPKGDLKVESLDNCSLDCASFSADDLNLTSSSKGSTSKATSGYEARQITDFCEPTAPKPMRMSGVAPPPPFSGSSSPPEAERLLIAEETIQKLNREALGAQAEIFEMQVELQDARQTLQALYKNNPGLLRSSRFGRASQHRANGQSQSTLSVVEHTERSPASNSGVSVRQGIQFDPNAHEEHHIDIDSMPLQQFTGPRKSMAANRRVSQAPPRPVSATGFLSSSASFGPKRPQAFVDMIKKNRTLSVLPGAERAQQFSVKNSIASSPGSMGTRSALKNKKAPGLAGLPEPVNGDRRSHNSDEGEVITVEDDLSPKAFDHSSQYSSQVGLSSQTSSHCTGFRSSTHSQPDLPSWALKSQRSSHQSHNSAEAEFEVLPGWGADTASDKLAHALTTWGDGKKCRSTKDLGLIIGNEPEEERKSHCSRIILPPKSPWRLSWDVFGIGFTSYDAFVIPLAFLDLVENAFTIGMSWLTRLFWTFDIFMSCVTGYNSFNGDLEMRPRQICRRYFRTWFVFDAMLVCADWMQEMLTEGLSAAGRMGKGGKIARIVRILRLVRLLRAARLKYTLAAWFENIQLSEQLAIVSNISISMLAILCAIHLIGCIWYAIGTSSDENWAIVFSVEEKPFWSRYCHSLFWATGQFTGGVDPEPLNNGERTFIIFVMLFAFVIATCFVSSFTSSLTQFHIISSHQSAQFQMLKRYMRQHNISQKLSVRITRNAKHVLSEKQRKTPEEDVELLRLVSEPLRLELHFEMYFPTVSIHPLFQRYCEENAQSMRKICHAALSLLSFSAGDILFSTGEEPAARDMIFVTDGSFDYLHTNMVRETPSIYSADNGEEISRDSLTMQESKVTPGTWVCEPVIWTNWLYCGTLRASSDSQTLVLDGMVFQDMSSKMHSPGFDLAHYAKEYVTELKKLSSDVSDLGSAIDSGKIILKCYGRGANSRAGNKQSGMMMKQNMTAVVRAVSQKHPA